MPGETCRSQARGSIKERVGHCPVIISGHVTLKHTGNSCESSSAAVTNLTYKSGDISDEQHKKPRGIWHMTNTPEIGLAPHQASPHTAPFPNRLALQLPDPTTEAKVTRDFLLSIPLVDNTSRSARPSPIMCTLPSPTPVFDSTMQREHQTKPALPQIWAPR